jgi:signal transduction histidine kinase
MVENSNALFAQAPEPKDHPKMTLTQVIDAATDKRVGTAEEDIPHILARFYRANKGRSSESGGTGLGLSIAQSIVKDHAAPIVVRSRANGGSSFCIQFPARDTAL